MSMKSLAVMKLLSLTRTSETWFRDFKPSYNVFFWIFFPFNSSLLICTANIPSKLSSLHIQVAIAQVTAASTLSSLDLTPVKKILPVSGGISQDKLIQDSGSEES